MLEFIAFTIAFLALTISFIKRRYDEYQQRQHPERYQAEGERAEAFLRNFLQSLDVDVEEGQKTPPKKKQRPPPPTPARKAVRSQPKPKTTQRAVGKKFEFESSFDDYEKKTAIEERKLETHDVSERFQEGYGEQIVSASFQTEETHKAAYAIKERKQPSRVAQLLTDRSSLRNMVIMHEIITKHAEL